MSIYDQAYALARELKNSTEYQEYQQVKKEVEKEQITKKMLIDLQRQHFQLHSKQMLGQKVEDHEMEQFKKLSELAQMNQLIQRYLAAEQRLAVIMSDIQKITGSELEIGFKEVFGEEH